MIRTRTLRRSAYISAITLLLGVGATAQAGVVHNEWNYALDSTNDGSGGSDYETLGLAYRQVGDQLYFAISSNMPITGQYDRSATNNHINFGDLFLNFSSHNLDTADEFNDASVFAVRFSETNDSLGNTRSYHGYSNTTIGVFGNVTPVSMATSNEGYSSLQSYINAGHGRSSDAMGDLESSNGDVKAYLGNGAIYTNISTGTLVAGITLLDNGQLLSDGVDFGHFGSKYQGSELYGFVLDTTNLPTGDFTAHLFEECGNDGVAIIGNLPHDTQVPEPASVALFLVGGVLLWRNRKIA